MSLYEGPQTTPYKVWHIPQIPGKAFEVGVKSLPIAALILDVLADYDTFQYENRIKGDYANVGGILVWNDAEMCYEDVEDDDIPVPS